MLRKRTWLSTLALLAGATAARPAVAAASSAPVRVCVEVVPKSWKDAGPAAAAASKQAAPSRPAEQPVQAPQPAAQSESSQNAAPSVRLPGPNAEADQPEAVRPDLYLRRLLEYEVTHDEAYDAATDGCQERMTVEIYELRDGWTVFGRFTRYAREEKVFGAHLEVIHSRPSRRSSSWAADRRSAARS